MTAHYKRLLWLITCLLTLVISSRSIAAIETHENMKKGAIHVGDTLSVRDDKFLNNSHWATINNISVKDVVTFRMLDSVYMNYAFSTRIVLKLDYYSTPTQTTPTESFIALTVNYSPGQGTTYKGMDHFSFSGAYRIVLTVDSIKSPEIGTALPAAYQLSASMTINRKYQFQPTAGIGPTRLTTFSGGSAVPANQLSLSWVPVEGAEEYDVEWTTVDSGNKYYADILSAYGGTTVADTTLNNVFRNNSSRITTPNDSCVLSMVSNDTYILVRIRQVQDTVGGFRMKGNWDYHKSGSGYMIWQLNWNEPNLNWQYSAAFAEEGKKKEVISYFDGTLRDRQTVTINNTDNVGVAQENIYDEFGRAAASILPAPFKESTGNPYLHYVQSFNLNASNTPYSFANVAGTSGSSSCEPNPDSLNVSAGASKYYSPQNAFINSKNYNKYIPDAVGFPLSVTQYTADNTGRIKVQGGVGKTFQPGKNYPSYTTKYYYGKPEQWELDQLFGNDVGYAEQYFKNMVMDSNGQISISYLNGSGKTIATALTGQAPGMLDTLTSYSSHTQTQNIAILNPSQFEYDATALRLKATTTYLASVKDTNALLKYNMQTLVDRYPGGAFQICSNCYYELTVKVVNDCGDTTQVGAMPVKIGSADTTTCLSTSLYTDSVRVKFREAGEYYITFEFAFNKGVIEDYVDNFVRKGTQSGYLHQQFSFIRPYLDQMDFAGCLGDCSTCVQNLGTKTAFQLMFTTKLQQMQVASSSLTGTAYTTWLSNKYDSLKAVCDTMQAHCDLGPCSKVQTEMEADVSPGGQYALFDTLGNPIDTAVNVLYHKWRTVFPVKPSTDTVYYQKNLITKSDGTITSPYDASFTLQDLVTYWQQAWAVNFLTYHPEDCKLIFCNNMQTYENWDLGVQTFITTAAAIPGSSKTSGLSYNHSVADWLISADPFFKSTGPGHGYYAQMDSDLVYYSTRILGATGGSNKGLTQFIDYMLYCADNTGNTNTSGYSNAWDYCTPQDTCRVPDKEWQAYQQQYFILKAKYYDLLRAATTCAGACPVGPQASTAYSGPYITVTDNEISSDYYDLPCYIGGVALNTNVTTVRLHNQNGTPAIFDHNVSVNVRYRVVVNETDGSYDDETIIVSAGDSTATYTYYSDGTQNTTGEIPCSEVQKTFTCIISASGGNLDPGTYLCDGTVVSAPAPTPPPPLPAGCSSIYLTKQSRFNPDPTITNPFSSNATTAQAQGQDSLQVHLDTSCVSNANIWMSTLMPGLTAHGYVGDTTALRASLIQICEAGGDATHLTGASDLTGDTGAPYTPYISFGAAIKGVTGLSTFTPDLNPWLISVPPPYQPQVQQNQTILSATDAGLCTKLSTLHSQYATYISTHTDPGFYQYLQMTYGAAMNISDSDLVALQKGCNNCRFLLARNVVEPVFLDPNAQGCIVPTDYAQAKTDLLTAFGGSLDTTNANYQTIYANFMNQRWGFSLSYYDYRSYDTTLVHHSSAILCNNPPFTQVQQDKYACLETQIAVAANNGNRDYDTYIEVQKTAFRLSYVNTCSLAQANANLRTQTQTYHYTLYYYDQADNLIRTIPPEGVNLLTTSQQQWAELYRASGPPNCTYNGPTSNADTTVAFNALSTFMTDTTTTKAIELWLYNSTNGLNQTVEETPDRHFMFQTAIKGHKMQVELYTTTQTASNHIKYIHSNRITMDITSMLPLNPWSHVVIQGTNLTNGALQVYLNGVLQTQLTGIQHEVGPWTVRANGDGTMTYPGNYSNLKHLRLYSRSLSQAEISANYNDHCFLIATPTAIAVNTGWYRFNVPAAGSFTTVSATSTNESTVNPVYPNHGLRTTYVYNATNQVIQQNSPDGGTNKFWYDWLARLVTSQNDKQLPGNNYSYTTFDALNRVTEVGQKNQTTIPLNAPHYLPVDTTGYLYAAGTNSQITHTYYDTIPPAGGGIHALAQNNLRKRVAVSTFKENQGDTVMHATYYNYDIDGNVKTLYQQIAGLGIKQVDYEYDLVSGKVNFVRYQDGHKDQFYYKYDYDADNRLTDAWSGIYTMVDSINGSIIIPDYQKQDAHYDYYLHGPLARMELGDQYGKVQGVDYAYTLQGWLKGTNGTSPLITKDMGQDAGTANPTIARDAYGYALHYYGNNDYKPIGTTNPFADATGAANYRALYNGNIAAQTIDIRKLGQPMLYVYGYDQLNRIKRVNAFTGLDTTTNIWAPIDSGKYRENFTYDGNGNILTAYRNGNMGNMDNLSYKYSYLYGHLVNNKLNYITDVASDGGYTIDIKNQAANNYAYDAIGNLTKDTQAGISNVSWSAYGKIDTIIQAGGNITYTYNPAGQRATKTSGSITTYYVRDGQGNTLALYDNANGTSNWREQHLYGSGRLGMWTPNINLATGNPIAVWDTMGRKFFELSNRLENILATITDRRIQRHLNDTTVAYYEADVKTAQNYYAFGMMQPGMGYNSGNYRYGFNGKENDNDVKGIGDQQDYGMRIYDPRSGRFLSVDPLGKDYPELTSYQFASNNPIEFIDVDGLEKAVPRKQKDFFSMFLKDIGKNLRIEEKRLETTMHQLGERDALTDVDNMLYAILKHPGKVSKKINSQINDQISQAKNDSWTLLSYLASGKKQKAADFSSKMVITYGAFFILPEEKEAELTTEEAITGIVKNAEVTALGSSQGEWKQLRDAGKLSEYRTLKVDVSHIDFSTKEGRNLFWDNYNKPFLDAAINKGESFKLIDIPTVKMIYPGGDVSKGLNFYGRELEYLKSKGYTVEGDFMVPPKK